LNLERLATKLESNQIIFIFWMRQRHHLFSFNKVLGKLVKIEFTGNELDNNENVALIDKFLASKFDPKEFAFKNSSIAVIQQEMTEPYKAKSNVFAFQYAINLHNDK
jgi:hypothetical protein